ncbi:MAG TPA: TonB-dependent receptor [Caulobacteraceae bacterium]|nr:TonB-dependent receptor [Caulobacteraceae bacterium]
MRAFHIPAEFAPQAIQDFAVQSGLQVVAPSSQVRGIPTPALNGAYDVREALRLLLARTGLEVATDNGAVVVLRLQAHRPSPAAPPAVTQSQTPPPPRPARAPRPAPPVPAPSPDEPTPLQETVVTALKTETLAPRTPIALSVFAGQALTDGGVVNIDKLRDIAPSLEVSNVTHGASIAIRGVATTDNTSKGSQDVIFEVNGTALGRPTEMGLGLFDLDRLEVLRGPQGTLYGESATGGVLNIVTSKPQPRFGAYANFELGNYATRRGEGMVNVPVSDDLAIRLAGNFNLRDGFLKPVLGVVAGLPAEAPRGDENNVSGRATALWTFADAGSLTLTGDIGHVGGTGAIANALRSQLRQAHGDARFDIYYNPMARGANDNFARVNANLAMNFGAMRLIYHAGRMVYDGHEDYDPQVTQPAGIGGTPAYGWHDYRSYIVTDSHELRLVGAQPGPLTWVVGANYWREDHSEHDVSWSTLVSCAPSLAPSCNSPNEVVGPNQHTSIGLYGQGDYAASDALTLTLGLRYSADSMFRHGMLITGAAPTAAGWLTAQGARCGPTTAPCVGGLRDYGSWSGDKVTWRIGAKYQLAPQQMAYASVATGYKGGGFNDYDPESASHGVVSYAPENLTAYEVGYKGRVLPDLQFNTDVYYYDYNQYQLTFTTYVAPSAAGTAIGTVILYTAVAPATLYGWENEIHWAPSGADALDVSLALEHGTWGRGALVGYLPSNRVDWSGKSLDNLPAVSATVSYRHKWTLPNRAAISARISSRISSQYFESDVNGVGDPSTGVYSVPPAQYAQAAFTRTDLAAAYTTPSGKATLEAFVRNVEDQVQSLGRPMGIVPPGAGTPYGQTERISTPRLYGVRLSLRY